jgi:hypothetical protein
MCNNCIHKIVCGKLLATGGVNSCEHFKEERKGRWVRYEVWGQEFWECSECKTMGSPIWKVCPICETAMGGDSQ